MSHLLTRESRCRVPTLDEVLRVTKSRRGRRFWLRDIIRQPGGSFVRYAIQDDVSILYGTAWTWKSSGGTFAITCTSLAAAALRQGVKSTTAILAPTGLVTAVLPAWFETQFQCQFTSAPAAGGEVGLYWGFSDSATAGTDNPAGLTGTDAAGPNVDTLGQLVLAGAIVASNNLSTGVQLARFSFRPLDQYMSPVVYNNASVAFDATALHTVIQTTPAYLVRST